MNFKQAGILCLVIFFSTIIINQTYPNPFTITFPALLFFGVATIIWILFGFLYYKLYPTCDVCKGYGAINLNRRQKLVNALLVGAIGEKCKKCFNRRRYFCHYHSFFVFRQLPYHNNFSYRYSVVVAGRHIGNESTGFEY